MNAVEGWLIGGGDHLSQLRGPTHLDITGVARVSSRRKLWETGAGPAERRREREKKKVVEKEEEGGGGKRKRKVEGLEVEELVVRWKKAWRWRG